MFVPRAQSRNAFSDRVRCCGFSRGHNSTSSRKTSCCGNPCTNNAAPFRFSGVQRLKSSMANNNSFLVALPVSTRLTKRDSNVARPSAVAKARSTVLSSWLTIVTPSISSSGGGDTPSRSDTRSSKRSSKPPISCASTLCIVALSRPRRRLPNPGKSRGAGGGKYLPGRWRSLIGSSLLIFMCSYCIYYPP